MIPSRPCAKVSLQVQDVDRLLGQANLQVFNPWIGK